MDAPQEQLLFFSTLVFLQSRSSFWVHWSFTQLHWLCFPGTSYGSMQRWLGPHQCFFFGGGQCCVYSQSGNHPQECLAKFGYKLNVKACSEIWRFVLKLDWILAIENLKKQVISALLIFLAKLRPIFLIGHQKYCFKNSLSCFAYITFAYFFVDEKLKMISTFTPFKNSKNLSKT
jgi:hypothetical protein